MTESPQNPYSAPNSPEIAAPNTPYGSSHLPTTAWDIISIIRSAIPLLKQHALPLVAAFFITESIPGLITNLGQLAAERIIDDIVITQDQFTLWTLITNFSLVSLGLTLQAYFGVGFHRICLAICRGEIFKFGLLVSAGRQFPAHLIFLAAYYCATFVGSFFFIVPGVIVGIGALFGSFIIADSQLGGGQRGVVQAFQDSFAITKGQRVKLLGFFVVIKLMAILGFLACCIGYVFSSSLSYLALCLVYLRLTKQASVTDDITRV